MDDDPITLIRRSLGNAKSAGLANPNREAPPPPSGFEIN